MTRSEILDGCPEKIEDVEEYLNKIIEHFEFEFFKINAILVEINAAMFKAHRMAYDNS